MKLSSSSSSSNHHQQQQPLLQQEQQQFGGVGQTEKEKENEKDRITALSPLGQSTTQFLSNQPQPARKAQLPPSPPGQIDQPESTAMTKGISSGHGGLSHYFQKPTSNTNTNTNTTASTPSSSTTTTTTTTVTTTTMTMAMMTKTPLSRPIPITSMPSRGPIQIEDLSNDTNEEDEKPVVEESIGLSSSELDDLLGLELDLSSHIPAKPDPVLFPPPPPPPPQQQQQQQHPPQQYQPPQQSQHGMVGRSLCDICRDATVDRDNPLLWCAQCGVQVHASCYGVRSPFPVRWQCDVGMIFHSYSLFIMHIMIANDDD